VREELDISEYGPVLEQQGGHLETVVQDAFDRLLQVEQRLAAAPTTSSCILL